jgi:hypothetical protein
MKLDEQIEEMRKNIIPIIKSAVEDGGTDIDFLSLKTDRIIYYFLTLIQKEREEAYIEGRKAISKYFQEGHRYTVWLEGSNIMIADESKMTLTKELFDETLSQTKGVEE